MHVDMFIDPPGRMRNATEGVPYSAEKSFEAPIESLDRRRFLWQFGGGLGGIALAHLLNQSGLLADEPRGAGSANP